MNYKFIKKVNPQKRDEAKKWYATPDGLKPLNLKTMTRVATENTSTSAMELEGSISLFVNHTVQQLLQGHTVNVPGFGNFRVTFKSQGVEDLSDFNVQTMIKNPRILFTPAKEFRDAVIGSLTFENSGVLDNGINYASISDYRKAVGLGDAGDVDSGSSDSSSGGSDDSGSENPLG